MVFKRLFTVVATVVFTMSIFGCGENSNTNGTLTLTASAPVSGVGTADLIASATVNPARTGTEVNLTVTQFGYSSTSGYVTVEVYTDRKATNSTGFVNFNAHSFIQSQVMATSLQVTATCQGLSQTINIPVDKYVP